MCARCHDMEARVAELEAKVGRLQEGCRRLLAQYVVGNRGKADRLKASHHAADHG